MLGDIKLTPGFWAGKPQLAVQSAVEIRACHPVDGLRYTLDFSDLSNIIVVSKGRMSIEGDIVIKGMGWAQMHKMVRGAPATQPARLPARLPASQPACLREQPGLPAARRQPGAERRPLPRCRPRRCG
jgi:hypothetical protein